MLRVTSAIAFRALRIVAVCVVVGVCLSDRASSATTVPHVHVFIVAIGHFDHNDDWPDLNAASSRASEIAKFFHDTYSVADSQIHTYSDAKGNADAAHLRGLQKQLKSIANDDNSVVFLFVLSHGKVVDSSEFGHDLLVVATDTTGQSTGYDSDSVLGSGFLKALGEVGDQSIVFAFFDTCSSGALDLSADRLEALYTLKHQDVVAISSSGANQKSYDFSFTSAVLRSWKGQTGDNGVCMHADTLVDNLQTSYADLLSDQSLRLLTDKARMCLNGIGLSKGMVLLVVDHQEGMVRLTEAGHPAPRLIYVQRSEFFPKVVVASRAGARIDLYDADNRSLQWSYPTIDLASEPFTFVDLGIRTPQVDPYTTPRTKDNVATFPMASPLGAQVVK